MRRGLGVYRLPNTLNVGTPDALQRAEKSSQLTDHGSVQPRSRYARHGTERDLSYVPCRRVPTRMGVPDDGRPF